MAKSYNHVLSASSAISILTIFPADIFSACLFPVVSCGPRMINMIWPEAFVQTSYLGPNFVFGGPIGTNVSIGTQTIFLETKEIAPKTHAYFLSAYIIWVDHSVQEGRATVLPLVNPIVSCGGFGFLSLLVQRCLVLQQPKTHLFLEVTLTSTFHIEG